MLEAIAEGAAVAFQPVHLLVALVGATLGVIVGAIPGISATLGIALMVPVTFDLPTATALIFLGAIYCGAIYGGSISGILLNIPGTPAAVAAMLDGYEMTRQGRGGHALGADIVASLVGGQLSVLVLIFAAPVIAVWTLEIRSAEFFWIVIFAMSTIGAIGTGSPVKGLTAGAIGLLLGTVGMHPLTGELRYTFGQPALYEGMPVLVALVGLFSISQVLYLAEGGGAQTQLEIPRIGPLWPGWRQVWSMRWAMLRSAVIGTGVGMVPGAGADIAAFIGRSEGRRFSKNPDEYGRGSMEGVACAEAANNGVVGGSLIPMLTLGIPGNAVTAALLGGLLLHGLIPGAQLFEDAPDILYPFIFSLFLANIFFAIVAFAGLRYIAKVVLVPQGIIAPVVVGLAVIGAFSYRNMLFDVWVMLGLGLLGFLLRKAGFPLAPIILGIILGPLAEENLDRVIALADARGMSVVGYFFSRWLTVVLMVLSVSAVAYSLLRDTRPRAAERAVAEE